MALWLQVGLALLVPIAALAGVVLGWWLSKTESDRQWRRDQQVQAYADFVGASADVTFAVDRFQNAETDAQRAEAMTELKAAVVRFHNAFHKTLIVAHPSVLPLVDEIIDSVHAIGAELDRDPRNDNAIGERLQSAAVLRQQLSEKARKHLGFRG